VEAIARRRRRMKNPSRRRAASSLAQQPGSVAQRLPLYSRASKHFNNESLCDEHLHLIAQDPISRAGETQRQEAKTRRSRQHHKLFTMVKIKSTLAYL
jgi:hypothetical protein